LSTLSERAHKGLYSCDSSPSCECPLTETLPLSEIFGNLATALFIGALIGIERGQSAPAKIDPLMGLRTFVLVGEAGAISALLAQLLDAPAVFVGALLSCVLLVSGAYLLDAWRNGSPGLTTEIAAIVVFLLGGAVMVGDRTVPVALAVVTALVLALKEPLHEGVRKLDRDDVLAGLKLLFATFIVLPVLPREPIDPWGAINPYSLWWLVILIASISLVGYVGVRWLGQNRGMALTGLFGGLVSSTAVSLSFARRSKEAPGMSGALAAGVLIAWLTMAIRVLIEVFAVAPVLLEPLLWPMIGLAVPSAVAAAFAWRGATENGSEHEEVPLKNPFSLIGAIKIGALFAAVLIAVKLAQQNLSASGVYAISALAGLTDVDAITLSLCNEVSVGALSGEVAVHGILIAALCNTLVKLGLVVSLGARRMAAIVGAATVAMVAGGGLALYLSSVYL